MLEIIVGVIVAIAAWKTLGLLGRIFMVSEWPVQFLMALAIPPALAVVGAHFGLWDVIAALLVVSPLTALVLIFYAYGLVSWAWDWLLGLRSAGSARSGPQSSAST
jgi:hypothetical protein